MAMTEPFECPECGTLYQVVKIEGGPETDNRQVSCCACGAPLDGRDGPLVLKYFLTWDRPPAPGRDRAVTGRRDSPPAHDRLVAHDFIGGRLRGGRVGPAELGAHAAV